MRQPEIYTPEHIKNWNTDTDRDHGRWVPARPVGHNLYKFRHRVKAAFCVFIGRYDALNWEEKRE